MRAWRMLAACALATAVPTMAAAADDADHFVQLREQAPASLKPDRAYVLLRVAPDSSGLVMPPVLLRVPSAEEVAAYLRAKRTEYAKKDRKVPFEQFVFDYEGAPNLFTASTGRDFERRGKERVLLIEADPGRYVLYGLGTGSLLYQCFCLGTVSFEARPGVITDLGSLLIDRADQPSDIPELAEDTGLGRALEMDYRVFAAAVRPARDGDYRPASLAGLPRRPAEFAPVGAFADPNRTVINRLAPLPGVLSYTNGRVTDARTGRLVPAR